jgi:pyruvate dehydrogenase E2 component (dihydrolipoamide acetyltransferase)
LSELSELARSGKIRINDLEGGTFTVSSLGGFGGTGFTPIINAPEVAILGIARAQVKPVFNNGQFLPKLILPISLSYDHRVIDGVGGIQFTTYLKQLLENPETFLNELS